MDVIRIFSPGTGVNAVFYFVILTIFLVPLVAEVYQFSGRRKKLSDLCKDISGQGKVGTENDFKSLNKLLENSIIKAAWTRFKPTIVKQEEISSGSTPTEVWAQESFHDYLTPDALPSLPWLTPRIVNAIPQWLTVLGILGTFIGLVFGLGGLKVQNNSDLQSGIAQLVSGINTAYLTSIWGVTTSALFLFADRWMSDKTRQLTEDVASTVDSRFERITTESVLLDVLGSLLKQQLHEQKQQTVSIKSLNTDLSEAIRRALETAVRDDLKPVMVQMSEQVREMTRRTGDEQARAMHEMAAEFRKQMTSALSEGMKTLTDSMERTAAELNAFSEQTTGMVGELRKVVGDLGQAGADLGNTVSMVDDALESFASTMSLAEEHAERSEKLLQETRAQFDAFTARMKSQVEQMSEHSASFVEQFGEVADRMDVITVQVREAASGIEEAQQLSVSTLREIGKSVDKLDTRWSDFEKRFEKVNITLSDTAVKFADHVRDAVDKNLRNLDENLAKSEKALHGVALELEEGFVSLQTVMTRFDEIVRAMPSVGDISHNGTGGEKV